MTLGRSPFNFGNGKFTSHEDIYPVSLNVGANDDGGLQAFLRMRNGVPIYAPAVPPYA